MPGDARVEGGDAVGGGRDVGGDLERGDRGVGVRPERRDPGGVGDGEREGRPPSGEETDSSQSHSSTAPGAVAGPISSSTSNA